MSNRPKPSQNRSSGKTKTLRAKSPVDVLALVPYVLGFHPEDSLVLLTVGAPRPPGQPVNARVDLPSTPEDIDTVVDDLVAIAERNGIARAVVVCYSSDTEAADSAGRSLRDRLQASGVDVPVSIRADGERWFCLSDCGCGATGGTSYNLSGHRFTAEAVLDGRVTYRSRAELAESLVGNDLDEIERVQELAADALDRAAASARHPLGGLAPQGTSAFLVAEGHWVAHRVRRFLDDEQRLDTAEVGRLLAALSVVDVRDVAWAEMSRDNATAHVALWRDVVRRSPLDLLAPAAALLGFAAWLSGSGALAWCAVERAFASDPDYSLASLLSHALENAVPPSTWQPLDREALKLFAG
ncbi:MAG TPA: DUF4192 domain-containing protein [Nocardioidaceae bacterium]|nr:DUF4192 domain-containing protein [Nocardioidaceae bacterium]